MVYRETSKKEKILSRQYSSGEKCLIDTRWQKRMTRLIWADNKTIVTQISTCCNQGMQKSISRCTANPALKEMGYSSKKNHTGCQKRTGTVHTGWSKLDKRRLAKCCLVCFCWDIQMVGSENNWNMDTCCLLSAVHTPDFLLILTEWLLLLDHSCLISPIQASVAVFLLGFRDIFFTDLLVPTEHWYWFKCNSLPVLLLTVSIPLWQQCSHLWWMLLAG